MDRYIGRLLDNRYEILEIVGTGGMAVVYKARCHRLNRLVAIKILKDEHSRDEEFRRRFHAEGQAVAMLSHPNIVSVYDVSTSADADYIVMELIDGISLKQYMEKKGVLNWKETLHFALQIAKALEHAHGHSIVHRDIKPHNVMVLKNGSVKVMDFGIARVMSKSNTLTKEALGSVHYISPEQAKGSWVDNRSDLYALGVVMYEMMTGRPPYDGESPVAVAIQHINGGAVLPSSLNPNIPAGLEQIILKAMALDPKDRFANAGEMIRDMEEFRKNPDIIFGISKPAVDGSTRVIDSDALAEAAAAATVTPRTTAERVVQRSGQNRRPDTGRNVQTRRPPQNRSTTASRTQEQRRRRREAEEQRRSRMATMTIVVCCAIAALAIVIFMVVLIGGGMLGGNQTVRVPDLLGKVYAGIDPLAYEGLQIELRNSGYSEEYAKGQIMFQEPSGGLEIAQGNKIYVDVSMGPEPKEKVMENLLGQDYTTAVSFLKGQNLNLNPLPKEEFSSTVEEGKIVRTDPQAGETLTEGQTVYLYVSAGPLIKTAKIPDVIGFNPTTAKNWLAQSGFNHVSTEEIQSDKEKGTVVRLNYDTHMEVDITELIILYISKGPKEPEETKPQVTDPPETIPPEINLPTVTTRVVIHPPEMDVEYVLDIVFNGEKVVSNKTVYPGDPDFELELTGKGIMTYEIHVNGEYYMDKEVDFSLNG